MDPEKRGLPFTDARPSPHPILLTNLAVGFLWSCPEGESPDDGKKQTALHFALLLLQHVVDAFTSRDPYCLQRTVREGATKLESRNSDELVGDGHASRPGTVSIRPSWRENSGYYLLSLQLLLEVRVL